MSAVSRSEDARGQTDAVEPGGAAAVEQSMLPRFFTVGFAMLLVVVEVAWLAAMAFAGWKLFGLF